MEAVRVAIEAQHVWALAGAWMHNGELLILDQEMGDLVVVGRFTAVAEKPKRKVSKPRARKNGLAKGILGQESEAQQ